MTKKKCLKYEILLTLLIKVKFTNSRALGHDFTYFLYFSAEFNEMYFTSDWPKVRQTFKRKYSSSFTENKKKNLCIDFNDKTSLRSFVELKLKSLSSYTTLPFLNQMEMVLADLPNPISKLFLVNEIMTSNKAVILDFCDSIQDLVVTMCEKTGKPDDDHSKSIELAGNVRL